MGDIEKRDWRLRRGGNRRPSGYRPGPFAAIYAGLLAAGLAAASAVYLVLVHGVPGMAEDRADTLKTALLVIGGSGALAGLYVSYRKQRTDEANHLRDQDKLFTERYTAAVAQLGNPAAAVRLGGVYALARIADDSDRDRPTCLRVLCAYLRMPYDPDDPDLKTDPAERQVRTTAQTVIAERLLPTHSAFWRDAEVDLSGAYLIDIRLDGIRAGSLNVTGATFTGNTWFDGAEFSGSAVFRRSTFRGNLWFREATFSANTWFDDVTVEGNTRFVRSKFDGYAGFMRATFGGPVIHFSETTFDQGVMFREAKFLGDVKFDSAVFAVHDRAEDLHPGERIVASFGKAKFDGGAEFREAVFAGPTAFDGTTFSREHPPTWPDGLADPVGIRWDPPDSTTVS